MLDVVLWTVLALLVGVAAAWVWRQTRNERRASPGADAVDTLIGWPPESVRVLTITERQAYDLLRRALPGFLVMAQVPLARFIRVPTRHSYVQWLQRVGSLSADLLLCDAGSRVLAVVDIRPVQESDRAKRRHERMARVLRAAGIAVVVWREDGLPSVGETRSAFASLLGAERGAPAADPTAAAKATSGTTAAGLADALAAGDHAAQAAADDGREPVPSAFFDDAVETSAR